VVAAPLPPEIEGPRSLATRLTNRYVDRIQAAAEIDRVVAWNFLKVAGFGKPPASLMYPPMMLRVAARNWRRQGSSGTSVAPGYATANPST
jgi:hypothetical protein